MTTRETSRRAVLAGAAAVPTLALPAVALANVAHDPIFALIERHRRAWMTQASSTRVCANMDSATPDPRYDEANATSERAREVFDDASFLLLDTMPTSFAGMVALLLYVEQFNHRDLALPPLPGEEETPLTRWSSGAEEWPVIDEDDEEDVHDVSPQFAWALLGNARKFIAQAADAAKEAV